MRPSVSEWHHRSVFDVIDWFLALTFKPKWRAICFSFFSVSIKIRSRLFWSHKQLFCSHSRLFWNQTVFHEKNWGVFCGCSWISLSTILFFVCAQIKTWALSHQIYNGSGSAAHIHLSSNLISLKIIPANNSSLLSRMFFLLLRSI